jgi:ArsR family transcriptional regulator
LLRGGQKNVSQLTSNLEMSIAMVSHHLQILKHQGIVETEKQGRFALYRLHPKVFTDAYSLDLGCCKFNLPAGVTSEHEGRGIRVMARQTLLSPLTFRMRQRSWLLVDLCGCPVRNRTICAARRHQFNERSGLFHRLS